MIETWEHLQARLFHLGWLGEELPAFVATPGGAWLFRQMIREALTVAEVAAEYVAECERAGLTGPNGTTPTTPATWRHLGPVPDPTASPDLAPMAGRRTAGTERDGTGDRAAGLGGVRDTGAEVDGGGAA
ncbi:MAG TPA: hypothetical protein VHW44_20895 [Pseudonocardiaceae bacterium]|jgi:hypothetical protein|nr:hypothetical protein [Pseudonocardiaceae bacterium]